MRFTNQTIISAAMDMKSMPAVFMVFFTDSLFLMVVIMKS